MTATSANGMQNMNWSGPCPLGCIPRHSCNSCSASRRSRNSAIAAPMHSSGWQRILAENGWKEPAAAPLRSGPIHSPASAQFCVPVWINSARRIRSHKRRHSITPMYGVLTITTSNEGTNMMTQATLRKLNEMKLFGMVQGFEDQLASAASRTLSFEERFGLLVDQESTYRENRRLQRLLKLAKLREAACVEDIDFRPGRGLDRAEIASLALGHWIKQGINLIVTGPTGGGKTWLACALGNQACRQGVSVSFQRLPLLLEDLAVSHGDGSFRKR